MKKIPHIGMILSTVAFLFGGFCYIKTGNINNPVTKATFDFINHSTGFNVIDFIKNDSSPIE